MTSVQDIPSWEGLKHFSAMSIKPNDYKVHYLILFLVDAFVAYSCGDSESLICQGGSNCDGCLFS